MINNSIKQKPFPFTPIIAPICEQHFSHSFITNLCEVFEIPALSRLSSFGNNKSRNILASLERHMFDAHHFITTHCGDDTSLSHPQGGGTRDTLSLTMFPTIPFRDIFPSAPIAVNGIPMSDISATGQRYQQCLSRMEGTFGADETKHFRDHFFPKCQGEPVFELGYALDAKAHITSTIMEQAVKQRLLICLPQDTGLLKYFNYQSFRAFAVAFLSEAANRMVSVDGAAGPMAIGEQENQQMPTLGALSDNATRMKATLEGRRDRSERLILDIIRAHCLSTDADEHEFLITPILQECCLHVVTHQFLTSQIRFIEELIDSVPNTNELLRLMGAVPDLTVKVPQCVRSDLDFNLTPPLYFS